MAGFQLWPALAFGATYTETVNGDLTGNKDAPTAFLLTAGANAVTATTVAGDEDYLRVIVPAGHQLPSLFLTAYDGADTKSFIAFQFGTTFTETVANPDPTKMHGYVHFGTQSNAGGKLNTDLFPALAQGIAGFGAPIGFTTPLPEGSYTFWLHETSSTARTYTLTFNVAAVTVPVPTPTPTSTPNPTPVPAPTLALDVPRSFKSTKPKAKITGTSSNASSVTYTVGGVTKKIVSAASWSFVARLKPGKNVITIVAQGLDVDTAPQKVTVTYKKKKK